MNQTASCLVTLIATALTATAAIPLGAPGATYQQGGYPASKTVDGIVAPNNGWAVAPQTSTAKRIWWQAAGVPAGTDRAIEFVLNFRATTGSFDPFNIRRFTLSYTSDAVVSAGSDWKLMAPMSASATGGATLSINRATGHITLGGNPVSVDYHVRVLLPAGEAATGFSLEALPVSGKVGTHGSGNFVLTEITAAFAPPPVLVPEDITLSEGLTRVLKLRRSAAFTGPATIPSTWTSTGTEGADFAISIGNSHGFNFVTNEQEKDILVEVLADALVEGVEEIVINWTPNALYSLTWPTTTVRLGDTNSESFDGYMTGHGLTGDDALPDADPNDDGISNIAAYAFRLNPAGPFPAADISRLPRFTTMFGGRAEFPAIEWQLPQPWPDDVRFMVGESTTLGAWTEIARRNGYGVGSLWTGPEGNSVDDNGGPLRTVTVPATQSIPNRDTTFLKLSLEKISGGVDLE